MNKRAIPPWKITTFSFLITIISGTFLLLLPFSTVNGISFIDALFTSTSAVCVTGLIVRSTPDDFTTFGQTIILLLIQIGGLGIITLSVGLAYLAGKKSLKERLLLKEVLQVPPELDLKRTLKNIFITTFILEGAGAILLFTKFFRLFEDIGYALYLSLFHSVSAFCNAGFSLFNNSLENYRGDPFLLTIFSLLIISGGIGFTVSGNFLPILIIERRFAKNRIYFKLVMVTTILLIIVGTLFIYIFDHSNGLRYMAGSQKIMNAFFTSVTARTAGFNSYPITSISPPALFIIIILMFIGASPCSTGGGIKTSTFGVALLSIKSSLSGDPTPKLWNRSIKRETIQKSFSIIAISFCILLTCYIILLWADNHPPIELLFESTSAFGTVGLSMGITPQLSIMGKCIIIFLMFTGRIGPLTLFYSIGVREKKSRIELPSEDILIG